MDIPSLIIVGGAHVLSDVFVINNRLRLSKLSKAGSLEGVFKSTSIAPIAPNTSNISLIRLRKIMFAIH